MVEMATSATVMGELVGVRAVDTGWDDDERLDSRSAKSLV
jgi:hypothetical protein